MRDVQLASPLHEQGAMTRFDRMWEPLLVLAVALVLLFATRG